MASEWISTKEAMRLLGVGSTTVKRWADEGTLPSRRTAGGHRRFPRSAVKRLLPEIPGSTNRLTAGDPGEWIAMLHTVRDVAQIRGMIVDLHAQLGDWFIVADFLDEVSRRLLARRTDDDVTAAKRSIAGGHLLLAISAVAKSRAVSPDAPVALVTSFGSRGLSYRHALTELCLRSENLKALRADSSLSAGEVAAQIRGWRQQLVAFCGERECAAPELFANALHRIASVCEELGLPLVVGFDEPPPGSASYGIYCSSFLDFRKELQQLNQADGSISS